MATLLLTAVGTLVGGPLGGALGALAGRQIDRAVLGGGSSRQGPRLKELSVSTSSYGQAIARHFGQVRVSGTIIWATDLKETRETSGGGKGKPRATTFSYSVSLAVAVSSQPIRSIGRIWADGNLLRGAAGDLKSGGSLRVHLGHGDQAPDPLIASAIGQGAPGFRDCAYVVFEDLALGDFGNRIPALSFEVFASDSAPIRLSQLVPAARTDDATDELPHLLGFSDEGGELAETLGVIGEVYPLACLADDQGLALARMIPPASAPPELPSELGIGGPDGEDRISGHGRTRAAQQRPEPHAIRYYDRDRDYQPGVQRAPGRQHSGATTMLELPATMVAGAARSLCLTLALRHKWQAEQIKWRIAELDPSIVPGRIVRLPGQAGNWIVSSWEWLDRGVELVLDRLPAMPASGLAGDEGSPALPRDFAPARSRIWAFEIPSDGLGSSVGGTYFAAVSADNAGWSGAALFLDQDSTLVPLGIQTRERGIVGHLTAPLAPSPASLIERDATLNVELVGDEQGFATRTLAALASGANRLLVAGEVVQFVRAEQVGTRTWTLRGLLRGRAGTEHFANQAHPIDTPVVLLEQGLVALDPATVASGGVTGLAAIGLGDEEPAFAELEVTGISLNPLSPVHCKAVPVESGDWLLRWTRRARGQWRWLDLVDVPLVEETELYEVGAGPVAGPLMTWRVAQPDASLPGPALASLLANHGPFPLWVRQIGTFGVSPASLIKIMN